MNLVLPQQERVRPVCLGGGGGGGGFQCPQCASSVCSLDEVQPPDGQSYFIRLCGLGGTLGTNFVVLTPRDGPVRGGGGQKTKGLWSVPRVGQRRDVVARCPLKMVALMMLHDVALSRAVLEGCVATIHNLLWCGPETAVVTNLLLFTLKRLQYGLKVACSTHAGLAHGAAQGHLRGLD